MIVQFANSIYNLYTRIMRRRIKVDYYTCFCYNSSVSMKQLVFPQFCKKKKTIEAFLMLSHKKIFSVQAQKNVSLKEIIHYTHKLNN